MRLLVAGGAGYIGSITTAMLIECGHNVVIIDNLSKGYKCAIPDRADYFDVDISDEKSVAEIIKTHKIEAALHFAAFIEVGESVKNPSIYFENNTVKAKKFLDTLIKSGVRHLIFSSTAATYGEPKVIPIPEIHPTLPTNPYGHSKLCFEKILETYANAYDFTYVSLRYFNAAGAAYGLGEAHNPETHLIPLILKVPLRKRESISIFGSDYNTPDGTCIRDYIHVADLANAHLLALEYLKSGAKSDVFNLGNGVGFSVKDVIKNCEKIVGEKINTVEAGRRAGDPARLVASSEKIKKVLNWKPKFTDIEKIISDAWHWHSTHPDGYV